MKIQSITEFKENIVTEDEIFINALQKIEECFHKVLLVVRNDQLIGLISNGDLRRALLNGHPTTEKIKKIVNYRFDFLNSDFKDSDVHKIFNINLNSYIPVLDKNNKIINLIYVPYEVNNNKDNPILLLAGGKGTRLGEITKNIPKPLVEINGVSLIEYQLKKIKESGFKKIYISLHHMAEQIMNKVSELNLSEMEINFIIEKNPLGTAGSLYHLKRETQPVLTLNCDVVTDTDLREMFTSLEKKNTNILIGVRPFNSYVPYGVIKVKDKKVVGFEEKPVYQDWVSAGINIITSDVISKINKEEYLDMNELINKSINQYKIHPYYITERWLDVGSQEELSKLDML
tara:strand:- start:2438 stop:3472 length:1035 start_codon:yes stop_codon:yes gene_type:complete